jgi:hypothetical protein
MLHSICEEIGSASLNSVTCHFCRRPAHLTKYFIPQICGFSICVTYLRTAHLWLFLWRISYAELTSECSLRCIPPPPSPPPKKHRDSQSKCSSSYTKDISTRFLPLDFPWAGSSQLTVVGTLFTLKIQKLFPRCRRCFSYCFWRGVSVWWLPVVLSRFWW